jgi:hypothetical protein
MSRDERDEAGGCDRPYCSYVRWAWSQARDQCHLEDAATREAYTRRTGKVAPRQGDRESVSARTKTPKDYAFLSWVWEHFEDFSKCDGDLVVEKYTTDTGKPSPYEDSDVGERRKLCAKFWKQLETGELPELLEDMAYGSEELPGDDRVLDAVRVAVASYYGEVYARGVLSRDERLRGAAREADRADWSGKVEQSFAWKYRLAVEEPSEQPTTSLKQVAKLYEEWSTLTALKPNAVYDVVRGRDGGWVYHAPTYTWDEPRCMDELECLISEGGYVVGTFVYESEQEALEAQRSRTLSGAPRGETEWVSIATYAAPSPRVGDD